MHLSNGVAERFAAMQHEPEYRLQPPVDQAIFVQCTKILGIVLPLSPAASLRARSLCNPFSFFSFPCVSAGQARAPAPRVPANRRRGATNGRNGTRWTQVCFASVRSGRLSRRRCRHASCAGQGADRLRSLQLHRGRRRHRQCARGRQPGRAAPSGQPRQADDPVPGVRGAARSAHHHPADGAGIGPRRRDGTHQARPDARHAADGGGGDPGPGHQVRQRRGGGARRTAGRFGGPVRPDDDPACPRVGHEPHHLHQRVGPAGPRRVDHGPRPGDPGAAPADGLSRASIPTSAPPASPSGTA